MISGPAMWKNCASLSLATARASRVLPVPGGPCSSTPLGGSTPRRWNNSGWRSGSSTISRSCVDRVAHPAKVVVGDVGAALAVLLLGEFGAAARPACCRRCGRFRAGVVETTVRRTSCSAKAGALSNCRICSGMSALTRWCPAVATMSPSVSGRPSKLRLQRLGRALQPDIVLCRREDHPGRRLGLRPSGSRRNRPTRRRHWRAAARRGG